MKIYTTQHKFCDHIYLGRTNAQFQINPKFVIQFRKFTKKQSIPNKGEIFICTWPEKIIGQNYPIIDSVFIRRDYEYEIIEDLVIELSFNARKLIRKTDTWNKVQMALEYNNKKELEWHFARNFSFDKISDEQLKQWAYLLCVELYTDDREKVHEGDILKCIDGYKVIAKFDGHWYGQLICDDNNSCKNIPYDISTGHSIVEMAQRKWEFNYNPEQ